MTTLSMEHFGVFNPGIPFLALYVTFIVMPVKQVTYFSCTVQTKKVQQKGSLQKMEVELEEMHFADESYLWMLHELEQAGKTGIPIIVNGETYSGSAERKIITVCEGTTYMEDYIADTEGRIIQINFDQIRHLPDFKC